MSLRTLLLSLIAAATVAVQLASAAGPRPSAYSANYVGTTMIAPQQVSTTNFYTDLSLSAQSATAAVSGTS